MSSEITAMGTGVGNSAGKEDPVELDSRLFGGMVWRVQDMWEFALH